MTLIEHIHVIHVKRALFVPECVLCAEAKAKADKARPEWLSRLTPRELTTRRGLA